MIVYDNVATISKWLTDFYPLLFQAVRTTGYIYTCMADNDVIIPQDH